MAEVDRQTVGQGHRDENSAPDQHDPKRPKPVSEERVVETPAVSRRTGDAQYPLRKMPEVGQRDGVAAGFHAIYETVSYGIKHAPLRNLHSLSVVNKKGGFDCPSCAWPDPDGKRAPAEFCENGAKAIARESTTARVVDLLP